MSDAAHRARRAASLLRYGAVQFLVLVPCAMVLYAGGTWWDPRAPGYTFAHNFLSDLGMTHTFSGASNYASSALFAVALVSLGLGLVGFAWTWRGFAFAHQRARLLGHASAVLGTLCGLAFAGIGLSPFDRLFYPHAVCVLAGFGLLPVYVATLAVVMWRNALRGPLLTASLAYFVVVLAYLALILFGPTLATPHGHTVQVVGQKLVAGASILYILALANEVIGHARARGVAGQIS